MPAAEAGTSLPTDGVDLVDEDDGGSGLLGLFKQITHAPRADADIQLHKIGAGDRQKLHVRLARDGLGQQGLAGARRADQQHALGDARAHGGVGLRVLQEVHDLGEFFLLLVAAGDVVKGLLVLLIAAAAGARFGEAGHPAGSAVAHAVHHHIPQHQRAAHQQHIGQNARPPGDDDPGLIVVALEDTVGILLFDDIPEVLIEHREAVEIVAHLFCRDRGIVGADLEDHAVGRAAGPIDEGLDLFLPKQIHQLRIAADLVGFGVTRHRVDDRHHNDQQKDIKAQVPGAVAVGFQMRVTSLKSIAKLRFTIEGLALSSKEARFVPLPGKQNGASFV